MKKEYPKLKLEELQSVMEEMDKNKDGTIDIDEFIAFMHSTSEKLQLGQNSDQYQAVLALRAQRRYSPTDFLNYFDKLSNSVLYTPSFISDLHRAYKNLPSESFKLARDASGIGYMDIKPTIGPDKKPTRTLQDIVPLIAGYIIFKSATGIPIPDPSVVKRENIVNRVIKVGFYDNKAKRLVYGTSFVAVDWNPESEDVWSFNKDNAVGTNPLVYKWVEEQTVNQIEVVFEFVSSLRYNFIG